MERSQGFIVVWLSLARVKGRCRRSWEVGGLTPIYAGDTDLRRKIDKDR
jgi:hypothetical protein